MRFLRLYRALLWLYPASFRAEYAAEMQAIFAQRLREAPDAAARRGLWANALFELLGHAAAAHTDILRQDLAYAVRTLIHAPGFALTAIMVIALGIGANTAVFSIADFVLLRPLPYADADRLVKLWQQSDNGTNEVSPALYRDWTGQLKSYSALGAFYKNSVNLVGEGEPERVGQAVVTPDLLPILGISPQRGRLFAAGEPGTVILSHALWQSRFGGDVGILGRRVLIDGVPHEVIAVMPPDFRFPNRDIALWTSISADQLNDDDYGNTYWEVLGRLRPGVDRRQAEAEVGATTTRIAQSHPQEMEGVGATVIALRDEFTRRPRLMLFALCGAAACVLLIACANLANLLMARALERRRELLVRSALGAGRERLIRQSVTESLLLAGIGGTLGIALAALALPLLSHLVPDTLPVAQAPSIDPRIVGFALLLTLLTGLAFGMLPAWRSAQALDLTGMNAGARAGGGRRAGARSALVIAEVMACVVLLVSAGLLMRALLRLQDIDPGFRSANVLTLRTALPSPEYDTVTRRATFYEAVLAQVRALPGVTGAAYITSLPVAAGGGIWPVVAEGAAESRGQFAASRFATPGYFATMGIPLLRGRDLSETDLADQPYAAVVSRSFAERYWPGQDPVGRRFKFQTEPRTVVGVVGDVRMRGPEVASEPQVYLSYRQIRDGQSTFYSPKDLVIRSTVPSSALVAAVRDIIRRADPRQPISDVRTMSAIVDSATATRAVQVTVLGVFGALGALLAAIGIHGLLALAVSSRRHEIGVRMALGARRRDIVAMVMRQGVLLAAAGVLPGLAIAYAVAHALRSLLAGIEPGDAPTFAAVAVLCAGMTLLGSLLPTLRAVRIDPAVAFRSQV